MIAPIAVLRDIDLREPRLWLLALHNQRHTTTPFVGGKGFLAACISIFGAGPDKAEA